MSAARTTTTTVRPEVEEILLQIHADLLAQQALARTLQGHGVAKASMPSMEVMMAFACLVNHDRVLVEAELATNWADFESRGLVHGDMSGYSTSCLRLLLTIVAATTDLQDVRSRMQGPAQPIISTALFEAPADRDDLIWGDITTLQYRAETVDYVLIEPAPIFSRQSLLLHTHGDALVGRIDLPGEDGDVVFTLLGSDGQVYRHTTKLALRASGWLQRNTA